MGVCWKTTDFLFVVLILSGVPLDYIVYNNYIPFLVLKHSVTVVALGNNEV